MISSTTYTVVVSTIKMQYYKMYTMTYKPIMTLTPQAVDKNQRSCAEICLTKML